FEHTETLFDYLPDDTVFVLGPGALDAADAFWTSTSERHDQRAHDVERPLLPPGELYLPPQQLRERLNASRRVDVVASGDGSAGADAQRHAVDLGTRPAPSV